jgi:putative ABC transport system permease protein
MGQELRHAARRLIRSPVFTLAAVLTLALAIGANASIFAVVHRVVLNPLPYGDPDRLVTLDFGAPRLNVPSGFPLNLIIYHHLLDHGRAFDGLAIYNVGEATLTGTGGPERITMSRATPSLARVLRMPPALGRWFSEDEGVPGGPQVAVLAHGLWVRRYGQDPGVIGRSIRVDGTPTIIVGVMPAAFTFPNARAEMWTPVQSSRVSATFLFNFNGVARLRDGETLERARLDLNRMAAELARLDPTQIYGQLVSAALPLQDATVGRVAGTLWILLASVGLVLLVACANVANLFLVRSEARQREVAVRRALGATRRGISRYFLAESALLSVAGGVAGLALAWSAVRLVVALGPTNLPRLNEVQLDWIVVAFTFGLSVLATLAFGALPLSRIAPLPLSLHEGGRGNTSSRHRHRVRHVLMAGQVALALVLLVASGLMVRSFQKLRALDPGFNASSALTFRVGLPPGEYPTRVAGVAAHQAMLERLSAIPGVTRASASTCLPLASTCFGNTIQVEGLSMQDSLALAKGAGVVAFRAVAGGYVEAVGMRLVRGRTIDRRDVEQNEPVVVVNERFASVFFRNQDPIGKRIRSSRRPPGENPWLEIVGVVSNTPANTLTEANPVVQVFMPMSIAGGPDFQPTLLVGPSVATMSYVVRSSTPPPALVAAVRSAVAEVDPNLALASVMTLQDILDRAAAQMAFAMVLLAIAAGVALMLGMIGIYGVMSYIVSQRTSEIGVRLAFGAEPWSVARMIVRQGGLVTLIGIGIGLPAAFAGSRFIRSLLYDVSPRDPAVFAGTAFLLFGVAVLACWLPARRASRLSPLEALRTE